jgi:putative transposase
VFRKLAQQKESRIEEGHLMPDHVHMMISIPPKYAVSHVIGFIKGKSAINLARVAAEFCGAALLGLRILRLDRRSRRSTGVHQEPGARKDNRLDQMNLWR